MKHKVLKVHPKDNVIVALTDLKKGEIVSFQGNEYVLQDDINAKHIKGNSGALSIAASTGAGTSPSAVSVTGTDISGVVALTTGTSPSINAVLATITYNTAFSSAPVVVITPANAATASLAATQAVWVNITTTGFTINTNATAVVSSTAYKWNYVVIQ